MYSLRALSLTLPATCFPSESASSSIFFDLLCDAVTSCSRRKPLYLPKCSTYFFDTPRRAAVGAAAKSAAFRAAHVRSVICCASVKSSPTAASEDHAHASAPPCIHRYLVVPTEFILQRKPQHPQVVFADELAEAQAAQRDVLDGPPSRSVVLVVPTGRPRCARWLVRGSGRIAARAAPHAAV
eukprot:CAMPEP_0181225978 /NCGR_PEP_ID=MMETSP1096-20121128/32002_1 /TAXON_ID=156174 ORGANISM="Chrysochromulina ericina, Strain CCMP281" /NCGR_SAMPLE_ID=MMETSP1096 /ASSEMBLY_ACC=CAM_ASM_000453 /LENGTH=182 /DNA_ID=CAMNT_0023319271 /DNA_START=457 /DNA_END=1006 /DNA_ORIENTATION=-